jgi:hypothetical protein
MKDGKLMLRWLTVFILMFAALSVKTNEPPAPREAGIAFGYSKTLLLNVPEKAGDLFGAPWVQAGREDVYTPEHLRWLEANPLPLPMRSLGAARLTLVHTERWYRAHCVIDLGPNAGYQVHRTAEEALRLIAATNRGGASRYTGIGLQSPAGRPNSGGYIFGEPDWVLPIPGASYSANFVPAATNDLLYAVHNAFVHLTPSDRTLGWEARRAATEKGHYASEAEMVELATRLNSLLGPPPAAVASAPAGELEMTLHPNIRDTTFITCVTWPTVKTLSHCWLRLDIEEGVLAAVPVWLWEGAAPLAKMPDGTGEGEIITIDPQLLPDGKNYYLQIYPDGRKILHHNWLYPTTRTAPKPLIFLGSIPLKGTRLHVYAITPDGKTWYHREIAIPGNEE